ncbi:MAG: MdtA/MuxA family multidrug efflux RND transporter periplasmic adaptor subunit [Opitutales bacterium]
MSDDSRQPAASRLPSSANASRKKPHWLGWTLLTVAALVVVYATVIRPMSRSGRTSRYGAGGAPMPVTAEPARQVDLAVRLPALGTVTPLSTVTIHSRVDGELQKIYFQEGQLVTAGASLADIDPRPFQVQKMQAEAQLAHDQALLTNARVDLDRYQALLAQDSVAKQQVDTQAALVSQYEAAIKIDQAQIESAALQLTYAHITAPIAGRIGLRLVDQGNMVHAGDANGIAVITQLSPMSVLFSIPQNAVREVLQRFAAGAVMEVDAFDADGRTVLAQGRLANIDNQIDPTTGTVKLRADFANADGSLFPNQFVNVQIVVDHLTGATVVPTGAVQRGSVGNYVYVVAADHTVSVRTVETGPSEHGLIAITKGLKPGEVVVEDGVDKLREGSAVDIITRSADSAAAAPVAAHGHRSKDGSAPASH